MRHLGMVGTTFRRAGQQDLQRYTFTEGMDGAAELQALHAHCGFVESVYLATCNRVEIAFVAPPGVSVAQCRLQIFRFFHPELVAEHDAREAMRLAAQTFHAYDGEGAAEHLFSVAASLDSMTPGEAQILGQVKEAYRVATELELAGSQMAILFEEAFTAAKRVRNGTKVGAGAVSMVSLAMGLIDARLEGPGHTLVVVGAGEMAEQCGAAFGDRRDVRRLFVNRTAARAEALAQRYGGEARELDAFLADPGHVDVLLTATRAPAPFLTDAFFARLQGSAPCLIDLSVSRDVDPFAARRAGAVLYDLDELKVIAARNRQEREGEIANARMVLDQALDAFRRRLVDREMAPVVRVLRDMYQSAMDQELGELFGRVLTECGPEDQARLRRWGQGVVNKLAHVPTVGLKRLAFDHGVDAVDSFLDGVQKQVRSGTKTKGDA